jgi:thiaminase
VCQSTRPAPPAAEWIQTYSSPDYLHLPDKAEVVLDETAAGEPYSERRAP